MTRTLRPNRGTIKAMIFTPMQAFDDATTERNTSAAAALAWHRQQPQQSQPERLYLQAGYVDKLRIIDARFEQMMEPYRQKFRSDYPGQPLPPFMEPGYQSITPGSLVNLPSVATMKQPDPPAMLAGYPVRTWKIAAVIGVVGILFFAMLSSCDNSPSTKTSAQPVTLTTCETAMRTASREPDSTLAEPLIMATTQACGSKAAWVAAVKKFPAAMGMMSFTDAEARQSWELVCNDAPNAPACRG